MTSQRPNTPAQLETARSRIAELLALHAEWFCTLDGGDALPLRRDELDVAIAYGKLVLTSWTEKGSRTWKISDWEFAGEKLTLLGSRRMGAERPVIELVPRAAASAIALTVKRARQQRATQLGELACLVQSGAKLERATLSPGAAADNRDVTRELFCDKNISASPSPDQSPQAKQPMPTLFFLPRCCGLSAPANVYARLTFNCSG